MIFLKNIVASGLVSIFMQNCDWLLKYQLPFYIDICKLIFFRNISEVYCTCEMFLC